MRHTLALALALVSTTPLAARADADSSDGNRGSTVEVTRGAHGEKVYRIKTAIEVVGRLPAFFVLHAAGVDYQDPSLEASFRDRIGEATRHRPF